MEELNHLYELLFSWYLFGYVTSSYHARG
jgi:hypothetical protein